MSARNPSLSPLQVRASLGSFPPVPSVCCVTGGCGFVGSRLVEMLVERGATRVVAFDVQGREDVIRIAEQAGLPCASTILWDDPRIVYIKGDVRSIADVRAAVRGCECVWHLAAAVGPFHPMDLYDAVNYNGTLNVIEACRAEGVGKIVMSSSPSTRFQPKWRGWARNHVDGLRESELPKIPLSRYMQAYAETKAKGELAITEANGTTTNGVTLLTVSVAPHQVYGPRDTLFLPNILEAAGTGMLRVFGRGDNRVCFSHVDNYAHALVLAELQLRPGRPALGKFYIATDGDTHGGGKSYAPLWPTIDAAVVGVGFPSLRTRAALPFAVLYVVALFVSFMQWVLRVVTGKVVRFKLNLFNVFLLTMHRWFVIDAATEDLGYVPIVRHDEGWADTIAWFKRNWKPSFDATHRRGLVGLSSRSEARIEAQVRK